MNNVVYVSHHLVQAFGIANIAQQVPHAGIVENLAHLELLEFIARKDYQPARVVPLKNALDKTVTE